MSAAEIMTELPNLPVQELESIYFRASALLVSTPIEETPELLAALDEAEASYRAHGGICPDEMRRMVGSWKATQ